MVREIALMANTNIALYIYYLLIISPCIHVHVFMSMCITWFFQITSRKLFTKSFLGRSHMGTLGAKISQWRLLQVAPRARALLAIPFATDPTFSKLLETLNLHVGIGRLTPL